MSKKVQLFPQITAQEIPIGGGITATYTLSEDGTFTLNGHNTYQYITDIKPYAPLMIKQHNNNPPTVHQSELPYRNSDLLFWLCGFPKAARAHSSEEFQQICHERSSKRRANDIRTYYEGYGKDWSFCLAVYSGPDGTHHLCLGAFIDGTPTKECARDLLTKWKQIIAPRQFLDSVLQDRFGFTKAELEELHQQLADA